ncbi:Tim17/Tim22/Tim23/Pmp24 family-domain-containing protein [Aspergillus cavernicola]|uniref:Tim17/Tim22/Tim23/Pmp24 family-domain-containing protein n=1 Tax=Aspergillus cavernicola TaxID=176166 RepID=A0ABR4IQ42_9EURO
MGSSAEDHPYHPQDTIGKTFRTTGITTTVGLFTSAVQNTLARSNVGPWGIFARTGSTIGVFAAMGGTYEFVKTASANLREKEDHWNVALGGFFSGAILGLRARTFPAILGYGAALATAMGAFEYTGGTLYGNNRKDPDVDEFERRQQLRTQWRTSGEQTLAELGEGRGIRGPGYEDRRRERIKEAYGIDVTTNAPAS